jgi:phage-related protein
MATVFNYIPSRGFARATAVSLREAAFGDGYSQRAPKGVNNVRHTWQLNFENRPDSEANDILAFFETTQGAFHFLWTPPDGSGVQYKIKCSDWSSVNVAYGFQTVSVTFTQVFDL